MKTAILFGATGLIGNHLLDLLLKNPAYYKIKVFVRKEIKKKHPKLETYNINFNELDKYTNQIIGDDCFFCIGTTRKQTPDKLNYIDTELSLPKKIADLTKKNKILSFIYVSSGGANANSKNLYLQNKGKAEDYIIKLSFNYTAIIQPSLLLGSRNENRVGEKIAQFLFKYLSFLFVGQLRPFKAIPAFNVANAINKIINNNIEGIYFTSDKLEDLNH